MVRKTYLVALAIEINTDTTSPPHYWALDSWLSVSLIAKNFAKHSDSTVRMVSCKEVEELHPTMYRGVPVSLFVHELKLGHVVQAIKNVRSATGMGLKEAKDFIDLYRSEHPV